MHPSPVVEAAHLLAQWHRHPRLAGRFPLYTAYLESLANAERLNAVHKYLRPLIQDLGLASLSERLELVDAQCRAVAWQGRVPGTMPVPGMPPEYLRAIAVPTLLERRAQEPSDHRPHLWLALLPSEHYEASLPSPRELLQEALRLAPHDTFVIERLAEERLHSVWFACHHLPEILLAPAEVVREDIAEARSLITSLPQEQRARLESDALHHQRRLDTFLLARSGENAA